MPLALFAQQGSPVNCAPINPPTDAATFSPNRSLPLRIRKSAFDLTEAEIDRRVPSLLFGSFRRMIRSIHVVG
jgi:hypothetical protein